MLEQWMNEVYSSSQSPTLTSLYEWSLKYLKETSLTMVGVVILVIVLCAVLYGFLMRNYLKGGFLMCIIFTFAILAYYILIFQPAYPREQVVKALNSGEVEELLKEKERERIDVRGVIVKDVDYTKVGREDVNYIGQVDTERLKSVVFTHKTGEGWIQYSGYAYIEPLPEGTRKEYVEFYKMDHMELNKRILSEPFFESNMYNVVVYKR